MTGTETTCYAHYTNGGKRGNLLEITTTPDRSGHLSTLSITRVEGKRQARELARKANALCWNF